MCPVCTVAVISGLGISRLLGIDDAVSGLWIGALILSFSFVTIAWIKKRFSRQWVGYAVIIAMYLLVLLPLRSFGGGSHLYIGTAIGSVLFLFGIGLDLYLRKKQGKQMVAYQKVIIPVLVLIIASLATYVITK